MKIKGDKMRKINDGSLLDALRKLEKAKENAENIVQQGESDYQDVKDSLRVRLECGSPIFIQPILDSVIETGITIQDMRRSGSSKVVTLDGSEANALAIFFRDYWEIKE